MLVAKGLFELLLFKHTFVQLLITVVHVVRRVKLLRNARPFGVRYEQVVASSLVLHVFESLDLFQTSSQVLPH